MVFIIMLDVVRNMLNVVRKKRKGLKKKKKKKRPVKEKGICSTMTRRKAVSKAEPVIRESFPELFCSYPRTGRTVTV